MYRLLNYHSICTHSFTCREEVAEDGDNDFVFEEFVRLRVAGVEEGNNETEA